VYLTGHPHGPLAIIRGKEFEASVLEAAALKIVVVPGESVTKRGG